MFCRTSQATLPKFKFLTVDTQKITKITSISVKKSLYFQKQFSSTSRLQATLNSQYEQIPEYLKIHMFTPELEIIRYDELRGPFKNFLSDFIVNHLEKRANEVRLEMGNSNPTSRLNNDNVVRFMKVLSRLKQLFGLNGGNTEVLDAVLHSQSTLNAFEAKLAAKKRAKQARIAIPDSKKGVHASESYTQIPESLGIHEFAEELKLFKTHDLKKDFSLVLAQELLASMENSLKQVYDEHLLQEKKLSINNQNLVRFFQLFPKLQILLAWNNGATCVLDTLIDSQKVFELVEARIKSRLLLQMKNDSKDVTYINQLAYRQVPEDAFLEEYCDELQEIRLKLDNHFAEVSSAQILQSVSELAEANSGSEKGLVFRKLYRNLAMIFKHNHDQTFVLDSLLVNRAVFDRFESRLSQDSKPVATEYRGADHVISLLNSENGAVNFEEGLFRDNERTFQSALAQAMSKEEKQIFDKDPKEYEEIVNLTSDKIRNNYHRSPEVPNSRKVKKEEIEKYLKKSKAKKDIAEETKWREQKAFEWSASLYNNHRSFKAHNFFDPILDRNSKTTNLVVPMFPGTEDKNEYLILNSTGQTSRVKGNPLGMSHVPEDMIAIFQALSAEDLMKFLKNVEKLRKKGWRLIGSGKSKGMLVLSREASTIGSIVRKAIKLAVLSCGVCFGTLLTLNWMIDENTSTVYGSTVVVKEQLGIEREADQTLSNEQHSAKNLWQKLLWK